MAGTRFCLEINPVIPKALSRLPELGSDLVYSWHRPVRALFYRLDRELWEACGHNPKIFLRRVAQEKLNQAATDLVYLQDYHRVLSEYDFYLSKHTGPQVGQHLDPKRELIAYFCAEYGLHESFPIYSGGLGILAGDHCKAAADLGLPFVGVGLLYRIGYFHQIIDGQGHQQVHYTPLDFNDLPITSLTDAQGDPLLVQVDLPGRRVDTRVWRASVALTRIYLLDTDVESNREDDRRITYQLYGGDVHTRIQQEIVLGIGGVRALRALGLAPTVWHINEGHSAFMVLERCRELVASGKDFHTALEMVAAATVFTTHTPVPAGHDIFVQELMHQHFSGFIRELGVTEQEFLALGASPNHLTGFNQTALALRGSRFHNGVSRIHGEVAARMEGYIWPEIPPDENPMGYIANGVHVPTFLAGVWVDLFDSRFGSQWRNQLLNPSFWGLIDELPGHIFWSVRQLLKFDLIKGIKRQATVQFMRNGLANSQIERLLRFLSPEKEFLLIGFARRFATYKRATLLFSDAERLARILNDPERAVVFIFAGKAHPHDRPGQELIRLIHEYSRRPGFEGRVLLIEGYDIALARKLVTGVDVWLNTPEHPFEASGTSGMKAAINGVVNVSVLDGWWADAYDGDNGWAITPQGPGIPEGQRLEVQETLDILEYSVIPLYFERNGQGFSEGWVKKAKASMKSMLPRYNSQRMVMEYLSRLYSQAAMQRAQLAEQQGAPAAELAAWKRRVRRAWQEVKIRLLERPGYRITAVTNLKLRVAAYLGELAVEDVVIECIIGSETEDRFVIRETLPFAAKGTTTEGETVFELEFTPFFSGLQDYKLRIYPYHKLLTHRFEVGLMKWI